MTKRVRDFIDAYSDLIELDDWQGLLRCAHEDALLRGTEVRELVKILEEGLHINLLKVQESCFLNKFKDMLDAGHPNLSYKNAHGGIYLKSWLLGRYWTNLYGLNLDDALNALIEAGYNIEDTPDNGPILWLE